MKTLAIELRKGKRTGVIPVLLAVGVLGAAYAFVNFIVRKDTLLNLPLAPMDVLLTQLYGMIMVLNLFGIVVAAYYLLPFSMIVVCVMIAGRETGNNGILKMLALPVSRCALSIAKFCVLTFYLFMEMVVFLVVFVIAGLIATQTMEVTETLPILYLLKWCLGLFLTMLPCIAAMWAITVLFEKPLLSVGLNLLLVIPGVLVANTPLWIAYPYCYSGYLVSCSLHDFTAETSDAAFSVFPFLPCAIVVFGLFFALAVTQFGKKEMR